MTDYIPGSPYNDGFQARMQGKARDLLTTEMTSVYIQEWLVGWDDAHKKIISEARQNSGCNKPKCCKNFLQD